MDELRFMQAEKNIGSLKKNAYSTVHEREKVELKTAWKGNKKGGMSSQHQSSPLTLIGILWMICILDVSKIFALIVKPERFLDSFHFLVTVMV
ncbi:hypothetical protein CDAR_201881 [Caerostris darwini]|uniref:Uncharacterized protein n=1 Tax=Caerostris darwini TaxID=1538125 RepID=A0AAV4WTB6_9ARAC|nr:hypothetical protein CDAR_201881 [Caerostris darwini]